jgi:hypothetical protein
MGLRISFTGPYRDRASHASIPALRDVSDADEARANKPAPSPSGGSGCGGEVDRELGAAGAQIVD